MTAERVFAVASGSYSDYRILCACPTEADAEQIVAKLRIDTDGWHRDDTQVEEFMICTGDVEKQRLLWLQTTLWDDGRETDVKEEVRLEWPFDTIFDVVAMSWRWVRAPMHNNRGGRLEVTGTNHELVRKVYSDRRAELIASDVARGKTEAKGRVL